MNTNPRQESKNTGSRDTPISPTVRVGPLMGLPALVKDHGVDPEQVFKSVGFELSEFSQPDYKIPFNQASRLLARCVESTGCETLGLKLGRTVEPSSLGVAGFMAKSASDVGSALHDFVNHLILHDQGGVLSLTTIDDMVFFSYQIHLPGVVATDQIYDLSITIACGVMRVLCGKQWNPHEVLLSRRPPRDTGLYQTLFKAPIRFNACQSALVFRKHWLAQPLTTADSYLHEYLEKEANRIQNQERIDLLSDLERQLAASLAAQKCNVAYIAGKLGMHERTLNRRLSERGTTFRAELKSVRLSMASQMLADTTMPLSRIAVALDYADATAFSRAFKRWTGLTPTEWRVAIRSGHQSP